MKKILLVRTYKPLGAGSPIPPLGLLYISSAIKQAFPGQYEIKILDSGIGNFCQDSLMRCLEQFKPDILGLSTLSCETDLMRDIASISKSTDKNCKVIVGGPHATVASNTLLLDQNIDIVVIGEGESTIVELLKSLDEAGSLDSVNGIAFRENNKITSTAARQYILSPDALPFPSWDLIDIKQYANSSNWNGIGKEKFYFPVLTSRGCPYQCTYCHNIFGKKLRTRSPENVLREISYLLKKYGINEFHIIDDAFNYDIERAKNVCSAIINSQLKVSLAFPNGLRADKIDDELITLLKKAGAYKINFGFETAQPRLQSLIKKNLDIEKAHSTVRKVSRSGIITGGYFMFGLPTETRDDILKTVNFASASELDVAYFFKVTPYPGSELFDYIKRNQKIKSEDNFDDLHFYSLERSYSQLSVEELNGLILFAQQKFYLNIRRLIRGLLKSSNKKLYLYNVFNVFGLLIQAYIIRGLRK